jgi:hypothetical protein
VIRARIYIHIYRNERIYKESCKNTIIEKDNVYLIHSLYSWWINNTEFREIELMMSMSLSLREEICQLKL